MWPVLVTAVVLLAGLIWLRWNRVRRYWRVRGVPCLPPHPVLGSLTFLRKENPALWFRRAYKSFSGPYFGMWLFWRPALVVNCPRLARRVLLKDADNFRNHFLSSGKSDPIGSLNVFACNDPLWSSIRKRMSPVFTTAKLRAFQGNVRTKANDLVERIERDMKHKQIYHIRNLLTDYTTDVIGESAFGLKSECTKTGDSIIRKVTRQFMEFSFIRSLSWCSIFYMPEMVDISRGLLTFFPKDTIRYLRVLFRGMLQQRGEVTGTRDLLDALINMKQAAAKEGEEMSEDLLLAQAAIFLLGGFDTSGATMTMILYELAHNLDLQGKLYNELREAKEKIGDADFDDSLLMELPYLNAVIKETLRMYPPFGWLDRVSEQEYKVDEKLTLPAGSVVYVNAVGMHFDPQYFPQPELFLPERFLPENERNIQPYTYLPFGDGPRACIGRRFAQQTIRIALAFIFLRFSVHPPAGAPPPRRVEFDTRGIFYMPTEELSLIFTTREQEQRLIDA